MRANMTEASKRAKLLMKTPNPAYLSWLEEWLQKARELNHPRRVQELTLAAESLKKFPVRLSSAKECIILENFSRQLVDEMEMRERRDGGVGKPENASLCPRTKSPTKADFMQSPTKSSREIGLGKTMVLSPSKHPKPKTSSPLRASKPKASSPAKTSKSKSFSPTKVTTRKLTPTKTIQAGVSSSSSYTVMAQESHHKQLSLVQDLIAPRKAPRKKRNLQDDMAEPMDTHEAPVEPETIIFPPGTFKIILLIDTGEKGFLSSVAEFSDPGLFSEVRHLKVGDYAWVARGPSDKELVLPFLVERKRLDDLSKSVRDGRFSEQKFRLKMSNIPNIIYLIENHDVRGNTQSIVQGISNMLMKDLFTVKETRDSLDSMRYLANMTRYLSLTTVGKTLVSSTEYEPECGLQSELVRLPEFGYFFAGMGKLRTFTTKEMFTKQLVQLHGLSADKAWAIVSKYPTPKALIEAFTASGASLLSDLTCGLLNRKLGQNISSVLYKFYTSTDFQ